MQNLYELRDIKKSYGGHFMMRIPYLAFKEGGQYVICGPNGSGKSTLLNMLGLLEAPDEGRISLKGGISSAGVVTLMQDPYLFKTTVLENVIFGLRLRAADKRKAAEKARPLMERLGIWKLKNKPAYALSGGEARKVALARAMAPGTKVLLLDEPTAHIDKESAFLIEQMIASIGRDTGRTVIMTTHDLSRAERVASRIIYISDGRVKNGANG